MAEKGSKHTAATRSKISAALKGRNPSFLGKRHSPNAKRRMVAAWTPERRFRQAEVARNRNKDPEFCRLNGQRLRGKKHPPRSLEARQRIGDFWRGRKRSPEQTRKWRIWWGTLAEEQQTRILQRLNVSRSSLSKIGTSLEQSVLQFLCSLGILFSRQVPFGRYLADFYLPRYRLIIECDGEYWHQDKEHDAKRDSYMAKIGLSVAHLRECFIQSKEYEPWLRRLLGQPSNP